MRGYYFFKGLKITVLVALAITVFGSVVMWLWNCLMPDIFGLPEVTFWQAMGLLVLSKIFFSGFRGGHHHRGGHCRNGKCGHGAYGGRHEYWKNRMKAKMERMSPEKREAFREKLSRCGYGFDDNEEVKPTE